MNAEPIFDRYYTSDDLRWPLWLALKYQCRLLRLHPFWKWIFVVPLLLLLVIISLVLRFIHLLDRTSRPFIRKPPKKFASDPDYGVRIPDGLIPLSLEQIPEYARGELKDRVEEAEACGFRLCQCFRWDTIGDLESYEARLLDRAGTIQLLISWSARRKKKTKRNQQSIWLYCTSVVESDVSILSATDPTLYLMPEMRLPDEETHYDPQVTSIEELLRLHRDNLPPEAKLASFDCESLIRHVRDRIALKVQTYLDKKIYFELTPQEIRKLQENDAERELGA